AQAGASNRTALGFAEASEIFSSFPATFAGVSGVDSTSVLILYTAYGDANLDKTVDTSDFNTLASNFGGTNKRWSQGDFNYDGNVDTLDFNALAANFSFTVPADALNTAIVPEPATLTTALLATGCLLARRRR